MNETIRVQEFTSDDQSQISSLSFKFGQFYEELDDMGRFRFSDDHEPAYTKYRVEEAYSHDGKVFVAEGSGVIVGYVMGYIQPLSELDKKGFVPTKPGVVSELYVEENYNKMGIGKKLMETIENYLKKSGCDVIELGVLAPNKNARKFYEKLGYREREIFVIKKLV